MSKIKQLKDLNLLDRFLFSAVMEDEKSLESILEIILGTDIALKDKAQVEKELRRSPVNKRVYFEETTGESAAESNSERIQILQAKVEQIKNSEEMGIRFMNAFEEKMLERREGREEGKKDVARKMLDMGMKLEIIAEATGLSEDELENLRNASK